MLSDSLGNAIKNPLQIIKFAGILYLDNDDLVLTEMCIRDSPSSNVPSNGVLSPKDYLLLIRFMRKPRKRKTRKHNAWR